MEEKETDLPEIQYAKSFKDIQYIIFMSYQVVKYSYPCVALGSHFKNSTSNWTSA